MQKVFNHLASPLANKIEINGQYYLYFGGTAYLGMPRNEQFTNLFIEGIKKFGLNNGTSRNNNIQLGIYNEAESCAAKRFGAADALITSSGYLAAQLTVKKLRGFGEVLLAPNAHPAIWLDGPNLSSASFSKWATETVNRINTSENKQWVVISNSMNNLFPEIYDFNFLREIHSSNEIILIVDDSHGIGVNNNGNGVCKCLPVLENIENVVVASMAKALGVDAGIVLASNKIITQLKSTNEFLGASPPSAPGLYAFIHAEEIYIAQLKRLKQNIDLFIKKCRSSYKSAKSFPTFLIDDEEIVHKLLKAKILISSFPYPNVDSKPLNRIVLSSWHDSGDIEELLKSLM